MAPRRDWQLLALLCLAAAAAGSRDGVFVGYKEVGVDGSDGGGGDGGAAALDVLAQGGLGGDSGDGSLNVEHVAREDGSGEAGAQDAAAGSDAAGGGGGSTVGEAAEQLAAVAGRTVELHTQFGPIKVKLLEELAPKTTALVWDLAQRRGCRDCAFYRNEARPRSGVGPPYALLQGRLPELSEVPGREGAIEVRMGHVCFIPDTRDFFIAYADHPEWGTAHTVWGLVDGWFATDFIISQQWDATTHPEFGTAMRMLKQEVPIRIAVEGDKTYSGLLGPMHYE